jgi:hypothetical protein
MKQVVRWSNGRVVVREALVEDELAAQVIERLVRDAHPDEPAGFWLQFGRLCAQTEASEGLDWKPETVRQGNAKEVQAAYAAFLKLPKAIWDKWVEAVTNTDDVKDITTGPYPLPESADPKVGSAADNPRKK